MRCANGHFTDPSDYGDVSQGTDCPTCGTPYQDQPSPVDSEMEMRDMPAPGEEDQGGNPLKEGILSDNGWQNPKRRDESFASVQTNIIERQDAVIPWHMAADFDIEQIIEPGPHTVEVDAPGQPIVLQHDDPDVLDAARVQLKHAGLIGSLFGGAAGGSAGAWAGGAAGGALGSLIGPEGTVAGAAIGSMLGRSAGGMIGHALGKGQVDPGEQQMPQAPEQFRGLDQLSHIVGAFGDDFSSPTSQDHIPSDDTSDPEKVDPHEKNDGDNDTWQKDFSINDDGGAVEHGGFDPENSGGLEALALLLPLVLHHHEHGTGADDPLMHALDQMLEAENPGYKDGQPDDEAIHFILGLKNKDNSAEQSDESHKDAPPVKDEAGDVGESDSLDDNDIEKESARTAAGPHTPEQFKAVADLLRSQGREGELQNLIDVPDQYQEELAEVQNRQQVNPAEGPEMPSAPPQPAQEETPPGAGMPMPAPPTGMQPMGATTHKGADALAHKCPKCDSHTTGLEDDEGGSHCHSCGHDFKSDAARVEVTARWHVADDSHEHAIALPAADQRLREDPSLEQDSSLSWQDDSGQPLKVGQQYEMYSERFSIPDLIRIVAVKPNAINYELTSEYGIDHSAEVTKQDADLYHYTFTPATGIDEGGAVNQVNDPGIEENNDYAGQGDPSQQTDLSSHSRFEQGIVRRAAQPAEQAPTDGVQHQDPALEWLRESGAKFTLSEQREFIDERGEARNSDKLDLAHTHYDSGYRAADEDDFLFGL